MYPYVTGMLLVCTRMYSYVPVCFSYILVCTRMLNCMYSCGVLVTICLCRPNRTERQCFSCWKCLRKRRNMWNCCVTKMPLNLLANIFVSSKSDFVSVPTVMFLEVDKHMKTWIRNLKKVNFENYNMFTDVNFYHYYAGTETYKGN